MNLVERAHSVASGLIGQDSESTFRLLEELAGEVERLWAFEKEFKEVTVPAWNVERAEWHKSYRQLEDDLTDEIVELKAKVDTEGMMRQWLDGYKTAASQFQPILFNLLRAADGLGPEPGPPEDHHHE